MPSPELSRRGALGLVLAGLAASGCDLEAPDARRPHTGPGAATAATPTPAEDPDGSLVESVRTEIGTVLALVGAAGGRRPALGAELAPLRRLHRRHLAALPGDAATDSEPVVTGSTDRVRAAVRREELRLQHALADAAVVAESGPLAALLASMSAAVAQRLADAPARGTA